MRDEVVEQRVSELERRVGRIERRLQMNSFLQTAEAQRAERESPEPSAPVVPPPPVRVSEGERDRAAAALGEMTVAPRASSQPAPGFTAVVPPPPVPPRPPRTAEVFLGARPVAPAVAPPTVPVSPVAPAAPARVAAVPPAPPAPVLPYQPNPAPLPPPEQTDIEQTIGLRWAGWVGAVVLVIGAGLGIKYAYDQGWFELVPASLRLAMMSLGSFALIGAGEWVRRKISDAAAVGLFGAGVATLFLVAYAGHGYLDLYQPQTAFTLMGFSTLIGAAVAMRGRMVSIAVLALIGGNLAPLVLDPDAMRVVPFCSYLLMLQLVSIYLSWWGGSKRWHALRGVSLATTAFWTAGLLARHLPDANGPITIFTLVYAALYHAELLLSALKLHRDPSRAKGAIAEAVTGASFSAFVTVLTTFLILVVTRDASATVRGLWVASLAAACGAGGTLLALRKLEALRPLAVSLRVQAAALLVLAVPIAFSGATVSLMWGALAIAFALTGAKLEIRALRVAGVATWTFALANLGLWAQTSQRAHHVLLSVFGTALTDRWFAAVALALVGQAIAWSINCGQNALDAADRLKGSRILAAVASLVFIVASIMWLPTLAATVAIVALAWWLAASDWADRRIGWVIQSAAVLIIATAKWAIIDTISQRLAPGWAATGALPVLNPLTGTGLLISGSLLGLFVLRRRTWMALLADDEGQTDRRPLASIVVLVCGLVTLALTLDIDRVVEAASVAGVVGGWPMWQVKQMAWTMLWTAASLGATTLAARLLPVERRFEWHRAAAGLVSIVAVKFLIIDTLLWRLTGRITDATILANTQTLSAVFVVGALITAGLLVRRQAAAASLRRTVGFLAVLVIAWTGTLEIDRVFENLARTGAGPFADPGLAKQVALSVFWSIFAVSSVIAGFRVRIAGLRYFGLALFGLTLLKVVIVDLDGAAQGYRILSFMGLGLLLLGTSVLYGKLSPKLLRAEPTPQT